MTRKADNRRTFLKTIAFGTAAAISTSSKPTAFAQEQPRPNILFAIADDWSWPHASIAGERTYNTPSFDSVARAGVLFQNAYVSAPSCTPSRAAILTGQWHWRLEEGANLWGTLAPKYQVYPDLLEKSGYFVGYTGKGWGPGSWEISGRTRNPAGPSFNDKTREPPTTQIKKNDYTANFKDFLEKRPKDAPFCFWFGASEPHRSYEKDSGRKKGKKKHELVNVPQCLPDTYAVRQDILDYALEVDWFDRHLGAMLYVLKEAGQLDNTLVVVTSDNGMPFPRCKSNLYDTGTHVPLAVQWPARIHGATTVADFISLTDLAPTFLEAAGLEALPDMTGRSFMDILLSGKSGQVDPARDKVFTGKERHTIAQDTHTGGYPMRAVRTHDFLYIRNFEPGRMPAGSEFSPSSPYRDVDTSPTKSVMLDNWSEPKSLPLFKLAFGKRPQHELYDLKKDPGQINNIAGKPEYETVLGELEETLLDKLTETGDPRILGNGALFDNYPYYDSKGNIRTNAFKVDRPVDPLQNLNAHKKLTQQIGWKAQTGLWRMTNGVLTQQSLNPGCVIFGPMNGWENYTYELQAQRVAGNEGFLIYFRASDESNYYSLNVGGWRNKKHAIQLSPGRRALAAKDGAIQSNKWYDIKIVLEGPSIKCFLDGKQILKVVDLAVPRGGIGLGSWETKVEYKNLRVTSKQGKKLYRAKF